MYQKNALRLIPALLAIAFSGTAGAAGFQLLEQNGSGLGNAYAGSAAVAENASTVYFNPAGMTQLQDREVSLGGAVIKTSYQFNNNGSSTGALAGDDNGGVVGFVPNAYMSWALTKDIYLGFGIGAPFGLKSEYDSPWAGAAQSLMFEIKTVNLNPSIAWRATDWMSLGFGLNYQRLEAEYLRTVSVSPAIGLSSTTARLKLTDDGSWGWNAGALFTLSPATKIGVSYRSAIKHELDGDVSVSGPAATTLNAGGASSSTKASVKLPDTFIFSATHKLNDTWELLGDISWTGWSSIPKIDIIRTSGVANGAVAQTLHTDFRDTWRFAVGANYRLNEQWKLKFGIAYDESPVKDPSTRLVSLPDNNRTWFSLGTQWKPTKSTTVDLGGAYLYVKDAEINNNQTSASPSQNRGTVKGTYEDNAWILGAQISLAF